MIVVESPNKAKKISAILGRDWKVIASFGHVRDLPEKRMGVEPPNYLVEYVLSETGLRQIEAISEAVKGGAFLWLATDPDREGEAIAAHVLDEVEKKLKRSVSHKRVKFGEITESAVLAAVRNYGVIDTNLVSAQEARRVIDRRVGFLASPVLTNAVGRRLTAGRVQSVAVMLVVDRAREIANHSAREHFKVVHYFQGENGEWHCEWDFSPLMQNDGDLWMDREQAKIIAGIKEFRVVGVMNKNLFSPPPGVFTSSTLQQAASVKLGFDPAKTMDLAQALFEGGAGDKEGYISYHRTDSQNMSDEAFNSLLGLAGQHGIPTLGLLVGSKRTFSERAGAQLGHEGIRPTQFARTSVDLDKDANDLYTLIRTRAICSQLKDAVYKNITANLTARHPITGIELKFVGKGSLLLSPGWRSFVEGDEANEGGDEAFNAELANPVPSELGAGSSLTAINGDVVAHKTRVRKRFTWASLVEEIERKGIGRPSTYASLTQVIQRRGYVYEEKRFLYPSDDAEILVDALRNAQVDFIDVDFTAATEERLDLIAAGKLKYLDLVRDVDTRLQARLANFNVGDLKIEIHSCSRCAIAGKKNNLVRYIKGDGRHGWQCSEGHFFDDAGGRPAPVKYADIACPLKGCGQMTLQRRRSANGFFFTCDSCGNHFGYEAGKPVLKFDQMEASDKYPCVKCGKMSFVRTNGKYGFYWRCNDKGCDGTAKDRDGVPYVPVQNTEAKKLIECPSCHQEKLEYIAAGKRGPWWKCKNIDCGKSYSDSGGKPVVVVVSDSAKQEKPDVECPYCKNKGGMKLIPHGKYGPWWRCNLCEKSCSDKNGVPTIQSKRS